MAQFQVQAERVQERLRDADHLVMQARDAASAGDALRGLQLYRQALTAIGTLYAFPGLRDDTGTKLMLAEESAEAGRLKQALTLYDRVATSRTTLLRNKIQR